MTTIFEKKVDTKPLRRKSDFNKSEAAKINVRFIRPDLSEKKNSISSHCLEENNSNANFSVTAQDNGKELIEFLTQKLFSFDEEYEDLPPLPDEVESPEIYNHESVCFKNPFLTPS